MRDIRFSVVANDVLLGHKAQDALQWIDDLTDFVSLPDKTAMRACLYENVGSSAIPQNTRILSMTF